MPEITPDNQTTFDTSKVKAQIATGLRDAGILVTFGSGLLGLIGKHDLSGAITFMQSEQGLTALSLAAGIALAVYRQYKARHAVDVTVAAVKSEASEPAVILKGPLS